jgi:prefoldin beta subunit
MTSSDNPNNPGNVLASAVDAEVQKFRRLQEDLQNLQQDLQTIMGQEKENEMVEQELALLTDPSAVVYKMIGPVLIPQELDDAQQTVKKRLEFIRDEIKKKELKMNEKQQQGKELSVKIQNMQRRLQETTAQAMQAIAAEHAQK